MKRLPTMLSVISIVASSCVLAQTTTPQSAERGAKDPQPGTAGHSMDRAAAAGDSKPASGTLMQQREKGMSPQSASEAGATSKMKQ